MARAEQNTRTVQTEEVAGYMLRLSVFEAEVLRALCGHVGGKIGSIDKLTARNAMNSIGDALYSVMPGEPDYSLFTGTVTAVSGGEQP